MSEGRTRRGLHRLGLGARAAGRAFLRAVADTARSAPTGPADVRFEGVTHGGRGEAFDVRGPVDPGTTLLQAAISLDVDLNHYCGGNCSCGTCRVAVVEGAENLSTARGQEEMVLGGVRFAAGDRLACQARVLGPVRVRVPNWF